MPYQSLNPGPEGDVRDWEIMYVDQADTGEQPLQQRHFYKVSGSTVGQAYAKFHEEFPGKVLCQIICADYSDD